jgi:hypothetical protein
MDVTEELAATLLVAVNHRKAADWKSAWTNLKKNSTQSLWTFR